MKRTMLVGLASCLALGLVAVPARAQTSVSGEIIVRSYPDAGRRDEAATRVIVPVREVIVVERVYARRGWWKKPKYRAVTVFYDGSRFYRRPFDRRILRRVVVYEWNGRYFVDGDQWKRQRDRHHGHDDR